LDQLRSLSPVLVQVKVLHVGAVECFRLCLDLTRLALFACCPYVVNGCASMRISRSATPLAPTSVAPNELVRDLGIFVNQPSQ